MSEILSTTTNELSKPSVPATANSESNFSSSLRSMILEEIVERWREGLKAVKVTRETITVKQKSKVCGDQMTVLVNSRGGKLTDIGIIANGCCCLSTGIAYHMVDYFKGKPLASLEEVLNIDTNDISPEVRNRIGCIMFPLGILYEAAQIAIQQEA